MLSFNMNSVILLSVVMLSVIIQSFIMNSFFLFSIVMQALFAKSRNAQCHYANVTTKPIMLSVILLIVLAPSPSTYRR